MKPQRLAVHLVIASLNIRSLGDKIDDLLEVRRDRSIDVLCLVETWHDADDVCFRRLRSDGFQITDRKRPRPAAESSSMSTNHDGVAVLLHPGNPPASSSLFTVLAQRPSHLRSSMTSRITSTALSDTMNKSTSSVISTLGLIVWTFATHKV